MSTFKTSHTLFANNRAFFLLCEPLPLLLICISVQKKICAHHSYRTYHQCEILVCSININLCVNIFLICHNVSDFYNKMSNPGKYTQKRYKWIRLIYSERATPTTLNINIQEHIFWQVYTYVLKT